MKNLTIIISLLIPAILNGMSLEKKPVILWPHYDWVGEEIENQVSRHLQPGDYIVYLISRGTVNSFRSDKYQISKERVLLQTYNVPNITFLKTDFTKQQEGIGGVLSEVIDPSINFNTREYERDWAMEFIQNNDQKIVYLLEKEMLRNFSNLKFLSKACDVIVVMDDKTLNQDKERIAKYYAKILGKAKSYNPEIEVYAGLELRSENNSWDEIKDYIAELDEGFDGLLFKFEMGSDNTVAILDMLDEVR